MSASVTVTTATSVSTWSRFRQFLASPNVWGDASIVLGGLLFFTQSIVPSLSLHGSAKYVSIAVVVLGAMINVAKAFGNAKVAAILEVAEDALPGLLASLPANSVVKVIRRNPAPPVV